MRVPTFQIGQQIIDPETGQPQPHFVQWWNGLVKQNLTTQAAVTSIKAASTISRAKGRFVYG